MSFLNPTTAEDPFATNQEKAEPHYINPDDLTPKNWKSSDDMYPDRRGGFNKADRTLWRKDRYNAVYGRYRDKNGEYRNQNGHKLGVDNVPLLSFNNDKPFPGWANEPGSQFHPDDHPKVDADFYRNRENWPAKGLRSLALHPFEDDWNENGVPLKNEFHDLTTLSAFNGLNPKQLPDRVDMDKVFELQQQAIQNQAYAARQQPQQPNQTANTLQQIGSMVQTAAPLVMQGVSALAGAFLSGGTPGNLSNQLADTMHRAPEAGRIGVVYAGEFNPDPNSMLDFGKPTWESDLERNAQTLELRPGDNAGVVCERNLVPEHDPFERERGEAVPLAAEGGNGTEGENTGPEQGAINLAEQRYWEQVAQSEQRGEHLVSKQAGADSEAGRRLDRDQEFPDSVKGTPEFYKHLAEYYEQKYGEAPDYLMEYGYKYARKFAEIESELSPEGKKWVRNTMRGLQDKMMEEIKKDPSIVQDPKRFRDMTFETHSDAYLEGGLAQLGWGDTWEIGNLPEAKEWADWRTWKEASEVVPVYIKGKTDQYMEEVRNVMEKMKSFFLDSDSGSNTE